MKEYIERAVVKTLLERYGATDDAMALIDTIPAADVAEVRHGRWIVTEANFGYCDIIQKEYIAKKYTCSECGYETGEQAKKFACCPVCMARMGKEDEHDKYASDPV